MRMSVSQSSISGQIPIRPDLLQFVRWRENLAPDQPLSLPGHGAIATYITDLIAFARSLCPPEKAGGEPGVDVDRVHIVQLTARLRFEARPGLLDESFFLYADLVAYYFNNFLAQHWREQVDAWSSVACFYTGMDRKDAITDLYEVSGMAVFREVDSEIKSDYRPRAHRKLIMRRRGK